MKIPAKIPTAVFRAIRKGHGRLKLQHDFDLSQQKARYYLQLAEHFSETSTKKALILADLHMPYHGIQREETRSMA